MVKVLFFAQLREQLQCEQLDVALQAPSNVAELRNRLVAEHPHWANFLANDKLLFSVNQTLVKSIHAVNDGDEIAFFPPVTGG